MSTLIDDERLRRLLGGAALADLRQRLRRRYQRADQPEDTFTLSQLGATERDALAGLLGRRRSHAASMRLSHQAMDEALRAAGLAADLRSALEHLDGAIVDTRARRQHELEAWATVFNAVTNTQLAQLLSVPAEQGLVKRLAGQSPKQAAHILHQTQRVLAQLPAAGSSRSRLAADMLGDAHGLDNGHPVATLLLRALDQERSLPRARDVWAAHGVLVSELAKPVVALNLPSTGAGVVDHLLANAREAGEPLHLSLRQLLRTPPQWRDSQIIHVCENPDVVAAAADKLGAACPPLISIDGQLSAAPRTLLDQLHAAGCRLHYHSDFDWPGLTIGNGIMQRYNAQPWRFSAADYEPAQGVRLRGKPVTASWDSDLTAKMQGIGLAIHEEAQLTQLLQDLAD